MKINTFYRASIFKIGSPKTVIRIMKLTTLLIIIAFVQASAASYGQKINLQEKNAPLSTVLQSIKAQTGYVFFSKDYDLTKPTVDVSLKNATLEEALDACFKDLPLDYKIVDKTVFLTEKEPSFIDQLKDKAAKLLNVPEDIHGTVIDSLGQPLIGASVSLKDTKFNTLTDNKGNFTFSNVSQGKYQLEVTYIGYDRLIRNVEIAEKPLILRLIMHSASNALDQVQVIGYGEQTQRFNVGAATTVTAKQIEVQPVSNPLLALEGQVPGLTISPTSGAPGSSVKVQIRGQNTLSSTGGYALPDQPLFIIDGVPFAPQNGVINQFNDLATGNGSNIPGGTGQLLSGLSAFNMISPSDIESITILKDADATSIYGTQGLNGVVLITTKRGKAGKTSVSAGVTTGPVSVTRDIQMMNTQQYLATQQQAYRNDGEQPAQDNAYPLTLFDQTKNTDWFKEFYGGTANYTNAHASISGGSANTTFIISLGDNHQTYNFPGDFANDNYTLHTNVHNSSNDNKLVVDFGTDLAYGQNNSSGAPSLLEAYLLPPNYPSFTDAQGNLVWTYKGIDLGNFYPNMVAYLKQQGNLQSYNVNSHLNLSYNIIKGLKISSFLGYSRVSVQEYADQPLSSLDPNNSPVSSANFGTSIYQTIDINPQISYLAKLGRGRFNFLLGGEYKKNEGQTNQVSGSGYSNDALLGSVDGASTVTSEDAFSEYKYAAVFSRLNYIWDSKYIIDLTGRRDGSSNFGPGRQFGNFGSVAGGWIFSEEAFVKNSLPLLSFGKITLSDGTSGGDGVQPYQFQPNWKPAGSSYIFQGTTPYVPQNLYNPNYSWSSGTKINADLELGFLKDRIVVDIGVYQDRTTGQLVSEPLPIFAGFNSVTENEGATVQDRGWEIGLNSTNIKTRDFAWTSSFNISGNSNKLIAFPGLANSPYSSTLAIGRSTGIFMGYKYLGVNPQTGIFQYQSANGTPTYGPGDYQPIVNLNPSFFGGLQNTFTYKSFSLFISLQFSEQMGLNYIGAIYSSGGALPGLMNLPVQVLQAWQKPGDVSKFEVLTVGQNANAVNGATYFPQSTGAFSNASYIRLKTLSFSWEVPGSYARKLGFKDASVFLNAQNLFTITGYQVLDPENPGQIYSFPLQKTIALGLNINF